MAGMERDPARALQEEPAFWLDVLNEVDGLSKQADALASDIANATVALLSLISLTDSRANEFVRDGLDHTNEALSKVMKMQEHMLTIVRVARRRHTTLTVQRYGE